jgi:hypothetical protein
MRWQCYCRWMGTSVAASCRQRFERPCVGAAMRQHICCCVLPSKPAKCRGRPTASGAGVPSFQQCCCAQSRRCWRRLDWQPCTPRHMCGAIMACNNKHTSPNCGACLVLYSCYCGGGAAALSGLSTWLVKGSNQVVMPAYLYLCATCTCSPHHPVTVECTSKHTVCNLRSTAVWYWHVSACNFACICTTALHKCTTFCFQ